MGDIGNKATKKKDDGELGNDIYLKNKQVLFGGGGGGGDGEGSKENVPSGQLPDETFKLTSVPNLREKKCDLYVALL